MNLFELFVKIGVDSSGVDDGVKKAKIAIDGLKVASAAGAAAIGAGFVKAAQAVGEFAAASVKAFGQYEQLAGGADTLFGDASDKLKQYADEAYKTAGMSKNAYLENVTAFSAALINSLDGDTEKAADAANKAMVAISDNANKMGTSIDSIVGTYQSLARGNYQMLDNLKLGYGGTKTELERLLKDAEEYQKTLGVTADYSADSFSDIVEAIDVVQQKMGIAGATQAEAATTVEGSLNTLKASWDNLVVSFGQGGEAMDAAMDQFFESFEIAADQVLPVVERVLTGIAEMLPTFVSKLIEMLPGLVSTLIPAILDAAISLVFAIIESLPEFAQMIIENIPVIIQMIIEAIPRLVVELLAAVFNIGVELVKGFWDGILSMGQWLWDQITGFFGGIIDGIKGIFGIHSPSRVFKEEIGKNLALGIGEGFSEEMDKVSREMKDSLGSVTGNLSAEITTASYDKPASAHSLSPSYGDISVTVNVGGSNASAEDIAEAVARELQILLDRRNAAYGYA